MFTHYQDYDLTEANSFGIHARADHFLQYDSEEALDEALGWLHVQGQGLPVLHVGGGCNLLFLHDFHGVVMRSAIMGVEELESDAEHLVLRVGAGMEWDALVDHCVSHGWYGLENLSLIPGQVGASAVQNIGAYGAEASQRIVGVECVDLRNGTRRLFAPSECDYGYRMSVFKTRCKGQYAVTRVHYRLDRHYAPNLSYRGIRDLILSQGIDPASVTAAQVRQAVIDIRRQKLPDPHEQGNAGSFFVNPVVPNEQAERLLRQYSSMPHYPAGEGRTKVAAGWLIEQCGWKGRSLGPAAVHGRQALVLVNKGGATGQDILNLCRHIQQDVRSKFGIDLIPEVNFIPQVTEE